MLSVFDYTVRADGKRTGMREQILNPLISSVASTTRTIGYDFDKAGRLIRETREERQTLRAGGEQTSTRITGYAYDEVSNRTSQQTNSYNGLGSAAQLVSTSSTGYSYNNADELTDETATSGAASSTKTYAYDDNGAQVGVTSNGVATPYKYDFEGKLVAVGDQSSSTRSSYVYDGEGNRISSVVVNGTNVKTTNYLNDTNTAYVQVLEERDENGTLQARYDYGDGDLQKLLRLNKANNTYQSRWFLNDGLDSTRQLVDDSGVVTDSYAYDAFGNTAARAGDTENTRLYNGQQQDETGLYFLRARYMNTQTGRFLSHDPLMGGADDPVTLHRYLYAANDPVDFVDPGGKEFSLSGMMTSTGISTSLRAEASNVYLQILDGVSNALGVDLSMEGVGAALINKNTGLSITSDQIRTAELAFAVFQLGRYAVGKFKKLRLGIRQHKSGLTNAVGELGEVVGGTFCFAAGTPVLMADGSLKPIEKIKKGDKVLSRNAKTGRDEAKSVEDTTKHVSATLVLKFENGERIETTKVHPFYVLGRGFVKAGELGIGTSIVTRAGPALRVLDIQVKAQPVAVYNFSVEDFHTYFVGNAHIWVHNADSCKLDRALDGSVGDNYQAHHLIPGELEDMRIVQHAQANGWDIDAATNGMHLPDNWGLSRTDNLPLHNTNHDAYTRMVRGQLENIPYETLSPVQLMTRLDEVSDFNRQWLTNLGGDVRVPRR